MENFTTNITQGPVDMDIHEPNLEVIVLSSVFLVVMVIGLVINSVVFLTYTKTPHLQTPTNAFIIGCVVCDVTMLMFGFPSVIAAGYKGWWFFGDFWCKGYGFVSTVIGVSSVAMLTIVAIDRYLIIMNIPLSVKITMSKARVTIVICFMYGVLWAMFPLFGWGGYVLEHSKISCGPNWHSREPMDKSYNIALFLCVFLVPILIISYCYFHILITVRKQRVCVNMQSDSRKIRERKVAISVLVTIGSFLLAWTPYAVMSIWSMFNDITLLSETIALVPPLMAKSACAWNPIVYVVKNRDFRSAFASLIQGLVSGNRRRVNSLKPELNVPGEKTTSNLQCPNRITVENINSSNI